MMSQEANDLITRTGPKDPCGKLMRMYWQPAALVDELAGRAAGQGRSNCSARTWCCFATNRAATG